MLLQQPGVPRTGYVDTATLEGFQEHELTLF